MTIDVSYRDAEKHDARAIAELFQIASDGVADYVWSTMRDEFPGLSLIEIGERRYAREGGDDVPFSYESCIVAESQGAVVGMMHGFAIPKGHFPTSESGEPVDPVLRPYAEMELPGSFYISGLAMRPAFRNRGCGRALLGIAHRRAHHIGLEKLSLIVFEQNAAAHRLYRREGFDELDRRTVVPHALIHLTGDVLLMSAPVRDQTDS